MIKIKLASKPVKLKINGIPVLLTNITKGDTPPIIEEYLSLVDYAIVDYSVTASDEEVSSLIGSAKIGKAKIV